MTAYFRLFLTVILSILYLSGCASIDPSTTNVEWQTQQQKLASIDQYKANGKLGYISPEQRQSLNFQWKHSPTFKQLRLTTFIGQTALNLKITPQGSSVETYQDDTFVSDDAQSLIYRLTGLSLPIEQLNNWLLGRPEGADGFILNDTNTLASLTKKVQGKVWQLNYLGYQDVDYQGQPLPLPHKLKLTQGSIAINIVISNWNLEP
ncbi:outer-membrane lipoprotein LolB [Vibrio zhanjiangensis]|uniref:Outer-membrane lipoprotein LolB n=1 Tax=Vibrio zhanjiangensis TaxID=1046128 RepID=A0ABQ6EUP2_9VIBR|nr:lipoprotein insertase outer membrane protein LolB [Vibrio zhanjiangensis]GLT16712.1 outer-membrane lipoprotein LolB [Vibrio zhanjiangensis]